MRFIKTNKNDCQWRRWFCWYPVLVDVNDNLYVWLGWIERRFDKRGDVQYREIQ